MKKTDKIKNVVIQMSGKGERSLWHIIEAKSPFSIATDVFFDSKKQAINFANKKKFNIVENYEKTDKMKTGGSLDEENSDMVLNNNNQISHHTKELPKAVKKNKVIPAWVVAKVNRSATDLSDATHYLEGTKLVKGGKLGFCYTIGGL
jgi:ribosomal protein L39E